jgi:hypothetical protein
MKKHIAIGLLSFLLVLFACTKKTSSPTTTVTPKTVTAVVTNNYSFDIGATHYSTSDVYGQVINTTSDTILTINAYNTTDTVSGAFTLHAPSIGTYTHTNVIGNYNNSFVVNFGNSSHPTSTFYSKSGTISITSYDNINLTYAGTFSGIMYLSTNPSYTLALTNGSFYYKY